MRLICLTLNLWQAYAALLAETGWIFSFTESENSFIQIPQLNKQQVS